MTLSQIQCFLVVADKMSITEAANTLYVTQPAVSHRINKLEQELGTELFYRDNSKIVLTNAGEKYVRFFREFTEGLTKIAGEIENKSIISERVVVGCADGWDISDIMIRLKGSLKKEYPGITVELDFDGNDELFSKIKNKQVDVALALEGIFMASDEMEYETVGKARGTLIYAKNHPEAEKGPVTIESFRDYPFYIISNQKNSYMSSALIGYCMQKGITPKLEYENSISSALIKMRTEFGVLVADEHLIQRQNALFDSLPLDYTRDICVGIRKDNSEAKRIVRDRLAAICRDSMN